jgi:hypothetical protein
MSERRKSTEPRHVSELSHGPFEKKEKTRSCKKRLFPEPTAGYKGLVHLRADQGGEIITWTDDEEEMNEIRLRKDDKAAFERAIDKQIKD